MSTRCPKSLSSIPTFREHDNLARLLPALFEVLDQAGLAAEVIVVDDDSRDGTDDLCDRLAAAHAVRLVTRRDERGLATAVLRGFWKRGAKSAS